ncbi:MAG: DNA polymerase III subunit beta, partial [Steroidobacteraceae bacterium]
MKFTVEREALLSALQSAVGVVERRQTMPILANVLVKAAADKLTLTATDLEVELVSVAAAEVAREGSVTVPARKLLDICRSLPEKAKITATLEGDRLQIRAGKSRFTLSTLPAAEFPALDDLAVVHSLAVDQGDFKRLLDKTHFAMAQQDVRYYLNGMLLETTGKMLRTVATDGHRLAMAEIETAAEGKGQQIIIPRKGVLELQRLLGSEGGLELAIGTNHIRAQIGDIRFTSKLIDGRFPEYSRVIPANPPRIVTAAMKEMADRLSSDAKNFAESVQKASDSEKENLRLELDKMKRNEGEGLKI